MEGGQDVQEEQGHGRSLTSGRGCVAVILLAETRVTFPLVTFFHADVIDDEVVDDQLLRAHPPYALLI